MKEMAYKINEAYQVIEPDLHDSNLLSIESDTDQAILKFRLVSGDLVQATLIGVDRLVCDNFREGNIVLDVTIESEAAGSVLDKLFIPPRIKNEKYEAFISTVRQKLKEGMMKIVSINPSYGCESIVYCKDVYFNRV